MLLVQVLDFEVNLNNHEWPHMSQGNLTPNLDVLIEGLKTGRFTFKNDVKEVAALWIDALLGNLIIGRLHGRLFFNQTISLLQKSLKTKKKYNLLIFKKMETISTPNYHETAVTQFIDANGTRYAYRVLGKQSGIPLITFQHFTGSMENWDPALTNGFAKEFKVIVFDNKGVSASEGTTPDNIADMAKDAADFIAALGYDKVNLLGFSMGGFIAQQLALDHPQLVNKMILAGTGPKGGDGIVDIITPLNHISNMTDNDQKLYLFYSPSEESRAIGKSVLESMHKRQIDRDPNATQESIMAQLQAIIAWGQPDEEFKDKLKSIDIPVLVVNGNNDIVVPTINSYRLLQYLPKAKLSLYPDSNHGAIFQYHDLFLTEAIPFLKD